MPASDTIHFLRLLFASKADEDYIVVCSMPPTRKSVTNRCFQEIDPIGAYAELQNEVNNVFMGVCVTPFDFTGLPHRGSTKDMVAMPGMWLDLDYGVIGHKKHHFETEAGAMNFLKELDAEPSILVHSGGGLQAYWLYEKMERFAGGKRDEANDLSQRWHQYVDNEARILHDREVDHTGDLARIFRLPGTFNRKPEHAGNVPLCRIIKVRDVRYTREYFENRLKDFVPQGSQARLAPQAAPKNDPIQLVAEPGKLPQSTEMLMQVDGRFKASVYREPQLFPSDSEYDLSIASYMAHANMSDHDIKATITWSRINCSDNGDKASRQDYIKRTINRARSNGNEVSRNGAAPNPADTLTEISRVLKIQVTGVYEYLSAPRIYELETADGGRIKLGPTTQINVRGRIDAAVFEVTHHHIEPMKTLQWMDFTEKLLSIAQEIETGELSGDAAWVGEKIREYLSSGRMIDYAKHAAPWSDSDSPQWLHYRAKRWLKLQCFSMWMWHQNAQNKQPSRAEWGLLLRQLGLVTEQLPFKAGDPPQIVKQWFWSVPESVWSLSQPKEEVPF